MKKFFFVGLTMLGASLAFVACRKSVNEPVGKPASVISQQQQKSLAQNIHAYLKSKAGTATPGANGASFIVPFFSTEAYGFFEEDPANPDVIEIVYFAAPLNGNDFYRENPNGTVSVHINSREAEAYYFPNVNIPEPVLHYGTGARYSANYTGPVLDFGDGFKIIDLENVRNAVITANGKVRETETSPWKTVAVRFIANPGGVRESFLVVR